MNAYLLIDFGSTYTKLTAVDIATEEILATAKDITTVEDDIMIGFKKAYQKLKLWIEEEKKIKFDDINFIKKIACSSAAGGLKMYAIGLVPELTADAAKKAALGAGARVMKTYSYELNKSEIEEIKNLGVEIKCNIRVGRDVSFKEIKKRFDYVFLAPGVSKSQKMGIEGEDMQGILGGIEFLRDFNLHEKIWLKKEKRLGERVAVIGGGNSAVDAARCALRLGAKVSILYRRRKEDMPAFLEEIKAAEEEGIKIECLVSPLKITGVEGKAKGLICQKMKLGEFDQSGRKKPVPIQGSEFTLNVDTLIMAIGQRPDELFEKIIEEIKLQTKNSKLFAGGDIVSGPSTVVKAIASGHQAAEEIDKAIRTKNSEPPYKPPLEEKIGIPLIIDENIKELPQARMPQLIISKRINNFKEVELGLTREKAIYEAERCLRCDAEIED